MEVTIEKKRKNSTRLYSIALSNKILESFVSDRNNKSLKDLKGKISFREDYDYKFMRN